MNRKGTFLSMCLLAFLFGSGFLSSCDQNKNEVEKEIEKEKKNPDNPTQPTPDDNIYSFVEQKRFLENTGIELLNMFPKDNFTGLVDFGRGVFDKYERYNWDNVQQWAEDSYNACKTFLGKYVDIEKGELYATNYYPYLYRSVRFDSITDYKLLLALSSFTGRFVATDYKSWNYEPSDILQFEFKDNNGNNCILSLTTSGETVRLMLPSVTHKTTSWGSYWDEDTLIRKTDVIEDKNHLELNLPKEIHLALTRDGSSVVDLVLKTDIRLLTGDSYLNFNQSVIGFNTEVKLENGYGAVVDELYQGNVSVAASVKLLKDNNSLLSVGMSAAVSGLPSLEFSDQGGDDILDFIDGGLERGNSNLTDLNVNVDILGKVQVKGKIENVREFYDDIHMAYEFYDKESKFKDYLNLASRQFNVGLYFNGSDVKQANVILKPFSKSRYSDSGLTEYWEIRPVIVLGDGSQTSTFEDYFDEKEFKKVIQSFEDFIEQYQDLAD